ncbi:MAG: phage capsid protein [Flavobacteriales bacterium]
MKRTKTIATVGLMLVFALLAGSLVAGMTTNVTDTTATKSLALVGSTAVLFGAQLTLKYGNLKTLHNIPGVYGAAIQQEMWADRIVEKLFSDDSILTKVQRVDDKYIFGGSVVHIPQAGAGPAIVKNRVVFPGVVVQRTDTDVTFALDVYTSDPLLITDAEQMEISYKKMDSALKSMPLNIRNTVTLDMLYAWAATGAAQIKRTTGTLVASGLAPSATGTRRQVTYADLVACMTMLDDQGVPSEDRYALFDAIQYGELLTDTEITKMSIEKLADRAKGIVAEVAGFKIMKRNRNTLFTDAATPVKKTPAAAAAATDNRSVLLFQGDCLNLALGEVKFFETQGSAEHYGDIYSTLLKGGGRQDRSDGYGVISLVQASS